MQSIRGYLIAVTLAAICLVNFIAALHGYDKSMDRADHLLDQQLADAGTLLASLDHQAALIPHTLLGEHRFFQLWQGSSLIAASDNAPQLDAADYSPGYHSATINSARWRLYIAPTTSGRLLLVGQRHDMYRPLIEALIVDSILPIIWVLPLLGLLIWWIVYSGLRPLRQLAKALAKRKPSELQAFDNQGNPKELAVLVTSINQLFQRLQLAFQREQQFAADAAHELRTPLTALKIDLHNLKQEIGAQPQLLALEESVERMRHSIEQILLLYRINPEQLRDRSRRCELNGLAQQVIIDLYPLAAQRDQNIDLDADDISVSGDPFALSMMLRNLLDNACKYTASGGQVKITIRSVDHQAVICLEDSGKGIAEKDRPRVFDRFYRVDGDRNNSGVVGSGLGLSIVKQIVELHGGQISLDQSPQLGGLLVQVTLPNVATGREETR